MTLADLRRLSIRNQTRIRFPLRNGMECVITEQGLAQVPGLKGIPSFNLEEELGAAGTFVLEPVITEKKKAPQPRSVRREELSALAAGAQAGSASTDHEDE